jgi:hypothetical protein
LHLQINFRINFAARENFAFFVPAYFLGGGVSSYKRAEGQVFLLVAASTTRKQVAVVGGRCLSRIADSLSVQDE